MPIERQPCKRRRLGSYDHHAQEAMVTIPSLQTQSCLSITGSGNIFSGSLGHDAIETRSDLQGRFAIGSGPLASENDTAGQEAKDNTKHSFSECCYGMVREGQLPLILTFTRSLIKYILAL